MFSFQKNFFFSNFTTKFCVHLSVPQSTNHLINFDFITTILISEKEQDSRPNFWLCYFPYNPAQYYFFLIPTYSIRYLVLSYPLQSRKRNPLLNSANPITAAFLHSHRWCRTSTAFTSTHKTSCIICASYRFYGSVHSASYFVPQLGKFRNIFFFFVVEFYANFSFYIRGGWNVNSRSYRFFCSNIALTLLDVNLSKFVKHSRLTFYGKYFVMLRTEGSFWLSPAQLTPYITWFYQQLLYHYNVS